MRVPGARGKPAEQPLPWDAQGRPKATGRQCTPRSSYLASGSTFVCVHVGVGGGVSWVRCIGFGRHQGTDGALRHRHGKMGERAKGRGRTGIAGDRHTGGGGGGARAGRGRGISTSRNFGGRRERGGGGGKERNRTATGGRQGRASGWQGEGGPGRPWGGIELRTGAGGGRHACLEARVRQRGSAQRACGAGGVGAVSREW